MGCRLRPEEKSRASASAELAERLYSWRKRNDFLQSEAALKLQSRLAHCKNGKKVELP
jgi:hypothetical protein